MDDALARLADNPFLVLELPTDASRAEIERAGQKLLMMLELGLSGARSHSTPLGPRARTPEMVRAALAELRDPDRRVMHELWALLPVREASPGDDEPDVELADEAPASFDALQAWGWRK
jgi:hypothetical protein